MYNVLCHSSIKVEKNGKVIYFDPFNIKEDFNDADYIFCTHSHYDHFSEKDIKKVQKNGTKLIVTKDVKKNAEELIGKENIIIVEPEEKMTIDDLKVETTYAYNIKKDFHPKINNWVGYIIEIDNERYYIAGDTDNIPEIQNIECDIAFIPVGGKFTMDYNEAASLANKIKAKIVVPTHYGEIVGEKNDGEKFAKKIKDKQVEIFIK
jgi:L-ascorbate metabolism protein UlaG (beta-lactamase superfamily)